MRIPSYRKHSSGQARVTINGKDHLLGPYGSPASKEAYGRLIAEFAASGKCSTFGDVPETRTMAEVLLAYLKHAKTYYSGSPEYRNMKLVVRPISKLYGSLPAHKFGATEFKAVRASWLQPPSPKAKKDGTPRITPARSRQYVNKQMSRTLRIVKWAVGEGLLPATNYMAIKCVEHAQELAQFILDATGVEVKVKQIRISFDICHEANIAQGWVDDICILQAEAGSDYCRMLQDAEAQQVDEVKLDEVPNA